MKRIWILAAIALALIVLYIGARAINRNETFVAPAEFRLNQLNAEQINHIRLAFAGGKEIDLRQQDGAWTVNGFPADETRVEQVLKYVDAAEITSRVSTNPANHGNFEVTADKALTVTLLNGDEQLQEMLLGKTAGGETVYVRLPDQDEVYVLSGVSRYYFNEDISVWRDRTIADFDAANVRQIEYTENQVYWKLQNTTNGWYLSNKWIAPMSVDTGKVESFLNTVTNLAAADFATEESVQEARDRKATFATVAIELGTPETFERRQTWSVYADQNGRYLVVRDSDQLGYYVTTDSIDSALTDYADMKTKLEPGAETPPVDQK